ncbi:MAG: putative lipid II flippase FtsW [Candidatus Nanopelagicales bacterium]|nr:putative lipid II flippase FtsW [Candidatus Nanopelagicales bacterium]MDZ4248518.1 putative lipid II flippase FtsW [Candidatus Nanopelagicales bacterium]MDZ7577894.1 putative lipid II flippase FtsW [Candidatus Nanopelagicales bacterium]
MIDTSVQEGPTLRDRLRTHPASIYYLMLGSTLFLLLLGVTMVWSASAIDSIRESGSSTGLVSKQALFAALGLVAMLFAAKLPVSTLRAAAWPFMGVTLALLVLVLVVGVSVFGQKNWLELGGPFRLQPSEIAKLAFIVWAAGVLARKRRDVMDWQTLLVPVVPVGGVLMFLVVAEGDFGNAMIIGVIMIGMLFAFGAPLRLFGWAAVVAAGGVVVVSLMAEHRIRRLTAFLDQDADTLDGAWQVTQGTYALGTGGWWGVGLGASREKWGSLPAAHTDFILPVIGEELGLFGTLAVLGLFAVLVYALLRLACVTSDLYVRLLGVGVGVWLMIQVITNVGAALKMLPITGVVLPLVSYGGSSLIPLLVGIGLLLGAARGHSRRGRSAGSGQLAADG